MWQARRGWSRQRQLTMHVLLSHMTQSSWHTITLSLSLFYIPPPSKRHHWISIVVPFRIAGSPKGSSSIKVPFSIPQNCFWPFFKAYTLLNYAKIVIFYDIDGETINFAFGLLVIIILFGQSYFYFFQLNLLACLTFIFNSSPRTMISISALN